MEAATSTSRRRSGELGLEAQQQRHGLPACFCGPDRRELGFARVVHRVSFFDQVLVTGESGVAVSHQLKLPKAPKLKKPSKRRAKAPPVVVVQAKQRGSIEAFVYIWLISVASAAASGYYAAPYLQKMF